MARFLENKNNIKKPAQKKKKKKQENPSTQERINQKSYGTTKPNVKVNTTRTANTVGNTNGKYQAGSNNNTQQRYNNRPQGTATRTRNTPATAGGSQYGRAGTNARRSASEGFQRDIQARQAESRQRNQKLKEDQERRRQESEARRSKMSASTNPRMQDTARSTRLQTEEERRQKQDRLREAQRQKMGDNSMASESAQRAANRAVRNTPTVVKESLKQTAIGHGKTAADLTELNKSAAIGSKVDIKSKEFQEDIEKRRKQSTRVAGKAFDELSKMQEKSEDRMQKVTGNAKGLEKAYYGALESGTGMALDRALGPAWAVSMLSRTYGNTRGQAKKEGATEAEDRAYSLLQGAKEVATEYLFQGVGLARGLSGRASLAPSEKVAKYVTRNMSGRAADLAHAGIRLLGGTLEENAEEGIGWGVDPIIKEFAYKKNVRSRQAQQMMREQSDSLRSNITSPQEAQAMAAYLGSDDFLEQQTRTYMDSGIGEAEARDLAEQMRDYLDASLSGDTGRMADIEESLTSKLAGKGTKQSLKEEYSLSELMDTVASTTLLTATTGLPGAFTTASKGAAVRDRLGDSGIRALAKTAEDFEDKEMQLKAKAMSDRLASGKDITSTQAYDLAVGVQEQYNKDSDRQQTAYQTANKTIKREKLVTPYTVSRNGDIDMDEVTDKTYQTTAKSAKDIIRGYAKSDESTQSLTDTEIDRGSRAIAGFQTGVFTVDDANELNFHNTAVRSAFQAETGIDLNQYVVKQKNGEIDIPATNAATKDALFAMAADNLVKSAQAETANWMDNAKGEVVTQISRRMGAKGTEALQVALDDVDERDRTNYMMTANATDMLYQAARNMGTDWESAKKYAQRMFPSISEEKLKAMYDAGLEDRIAATDNAVGLQIEIGKKAEIKAGAEKAPMGQLLIETDVPVKGTVARTFTELAKNLGVDIHLVDHFTDENGNVLKNVNGEYIDGNIYINVNSDFEKNMGFIFMHEVTHHLKKFAPEQYHELENLVRDKWFNYDAAQMQSAIAKKIETYAKHGQKLTEEQALEEIIADASHEFLTDSKFAREVADADASLAQAVLTSVRNALRALRRIMSSGNVSDETHMNTLFSQLDILDEAERIWLSAYTQAVRNNAAVEVDRLQNQIYEEGRQSVSDEQTDGYTIKDGNARWTDERIDRLIREYGAKGIEDYSQAYAVLMSPQEFLDLTLPQSMLNRWNEGANDPEHPEVYSLNEEELRNNRQAPFLQIWSDDGNRIQGHEGRHRMRALMEAGVKSVPVVVLDTDTKYSKKKIASMILKSQDFGKGPVNANASVYTGELVPIKESNRDELIQKFGGDAQVRFSIADTDSEGNAITEEEATVLHDIGPDVRFSMTTENEPQAKAAFRAGKGEFRGYKYEMSGRELRTKLIKENFPEDQADAIVKAIDSFMDATGEFLTDKDGLRMRYQFIGWDDLESGTVSVRRDKNGKIRSVNFSAMKKNDEYPVNFDFSTVCNKRISFTRVIEEIAKAQDAETGASVFSEIKLTPDNMWKINEALKAEGIDTACLGCFVESRRYHIDTFFQNVEDRWNKPVREARKKLGLPEEDYFNFSKEEVPGEQWSAADDNWGDYGRAKAFKGAPLARTQVLMNEIVKAGDVDSPLLKLIRPSDLLTPEGFEGFRKLSNAKIDMVGQIKSMYGAGVPKEILGFTPYNSEIALLPKNYKKTKMEKYLKSIGGIRIQSFSDFMIEHVYDHFQLIADAAYRKLPIHAYTKVIAYAKIFGLTGAKINMSVMFDVKNSKQWAEDLGISEADAKQYADKYQGLRFVTETPAEYKTAYENASTDEKLKKKYDKYISEGATEEEARRKTADWAVRPFRPITLEGKKGYLTYLVSDADYVNEQYQRMYDQYISEGMSEAEAERKANSNKPFEQSINYREAKALQDQDGYRENVGIIGVAFGDEHLRMMMNDENVRYIIPYHSSNLPVVVSNKTNLKVARDYSDRQNTYKAESWTIGGETYNDLKSAYAEFKKSNKGEAHPARAFFAEAFKKNLDAKFGEKVEGSNTGAFDVYKSLDDASEISDVSERYLEDCIENNYIPVFHEFADSPGYYKMLFDFMVADDNGSLYPQHEVRNNYPGVDVDAKAEAGETVTDSDLTELKNVIEEGAKTQNDKLQRWQDRKGNVMQDLLSREGEHSIIADSNINSVRYGTEDYTNPKTGEGIPKDARMSISEDLDEPYMAAVNAGNMEEAQKYVDEAAKMAGMRVAHRYHGTMNAGFTVFDKAYAKVGGNSGAGFYFSTEKDDSVNHYADVEGADNYFKWSSLAEHINDQINEGTWEGPELETYEDVEEYAKEQLNKNPGTYDVYLNYKNPYIRDYKNSTNIYDMLMDDFDESVIDRDDYEDEWEYEDAVWEAKAEHLSDSLYSAVYGAYQDIEDNYEVIDMPYIDEVLSKITEYAFDGSLTWEEIQSGIVFAGEVEVTNPNWTDSGDATSEFTRAIIENLGFDAIEDKEVNSKFGQLSREMMTDTEHIIVFKPEQIKLSDPVTYAEDGSVIPLSQRFDPTNNDIRYSLPTQDSDGSILSDGQMEYFKNSQARDESGRLVPVYHATSMGGFTIFDPSYSDDRRSLFFSNKRDVAQTYVEKHLYTDEDRLGDGGINIDSWERLVDYAKDLYMNAGLDWEYDSEFESLGWILYTKDEKEHMADLDEWGDTYDDAYAKWAEMAKRNDPEADKYRISISLPYEDKNGDTDSKRYTADSVAELLDKVSSDPVPQAGYYQVYLNLENPMIIDGKGAYWDSISLDSRIPSNTRLELITGEYLDALAESIEQQFMDEKNQREKHGYKFKDESLYTWPQYQKSKQYRKDAKEAKKNGIAYLKTETGERLRAEYSPEGLAKAINTYYGFEENDSEGMLIANGMLKEIGSGMDAHSYKGAAQLRELTGETHDTREWAEIAQAEGYDGVIFRNIIDIDNKTEIDEDEGLSDIYIAFSSNQVKDTRNENPTENPDIRYSITEDEGKSKKDYDHATDMSYEELLMYEDMIANASESTDIETAFGKKFSGEKVSNFYSALTEEVSMVFDDEILEEGRMRMAKSKADFWSNLNTKWQERWETKGEVLDTKSVKTNVRNLIRGVMDKSDTDRQYKTELLNKTLMDMRVAYQLMKQDRTDVASALLYHSALRMISDVDFIQDDTAYQEYKGIRDYLRSEPIIVGEDYWQGKAFQQFRKEHYGMLKLRKGAASNIDKVYGQLEELYPHIFGESERSKHGFEDSEEDLLQYIGFVTEQNLQPFMEAYSSEYCADWAFEIADDLYEIMENGEGVTSLADRYKAKYDAKAKAMKIRHAEAILRVRKQKQAAIDALKEQYSERLDEQKEYYNEKLDQQKEQYNERLDRQKELAKDAIRKERERFRAQKQAEKEKTKERTLHKKYFDSIAKSHKTLSDRLLTNTKDKHIPEQYKHDLAELLAAFDLQTVASKKLEIKNGLYYRQNYTSKKTIKMRALQETLANIQADTQKLFYVNDSITEIIDRLLGKNAEGKTDPTKSVEGRVIDELTASELKDIDKLLKALIHEFNYYESVRVGAKRQQAADIGTAQIDSCLDHAGKFGEGLDYQNFLGALDNIIGLDEMTPAYMFRQIDPQNNGIGLMFKELRRSFGKYVRNQNQLNEWMDEIIGEYHNKGKLWNKYGAETLEEWRVSSRAKEFHLQNEKRPIRLTPAQMMSIYCLSKRQQAYDHMTGAGIVVQPVSFQARVASDLKKKANYALPVILTDSDIKLITSQLTPDQIKVADKLQELMATKMAEWGNEASMSVLGIRLFEDPDYFPIKSDKAALEKDFSAEQFMDCIRNFGFTKAVQPGARNAIAIGDIFDVVAEHCNNMNLYNAYSESMSDFMKVYNYHALREDGSDYSVEQAIAHAYSKKATTFIGTFMKDLNGNVSKERTTGIEQMINDSLGKAKKASVFANGRVALQQPTALMRAFAVISPKYLKGVKAGNATMQEMFEHSPIALWKSWGYYDINMGKSIEDLMMNNGSWAEDKMSDIYGELDNRTWAIIWTMCKNEIEDKHKGVEKDSDEYWELVSERFDEVVDLTQVVDSPFHRSHAMRSKSTLVKMATAFMAEPTLTFNMMRDGLRRAKEEYRLGNKRSAAKIVGRTATVFVLSAWATAAAAAIWDAVRGKSAGDDDDEQGFFDMWYTNMIENLKDNLNLLNNIYWVKDLVSLFQGWDQRNLGLQGWKHLSDAFRQMKGEKVYSKLTWYENALAGIGYLSGIPFKTMMTDGKAVFKMFGLTTPKLLQDQLDRLDSIGSSTKDMNRGKSSDSGVTSEKASKDEKGSSAGSAHLWTYDNAPFHVEDGSLADNFLNHFGINLTSAELAAIERSEEEKEIDAKIQDIKSKTEGLSQEEKNQKIYSMVTRYMKDHQDGKPMADYIAAGDYWSIGDIGNMYIRAGGDGEYFKEKVFRASKTAMKKTISADNNESQKAAQARIKDYLLTNGMTEQELSDIAYKSYTKKDLQVAFRINDEDAIITEMRALMEAGMTREDIYKVYDNRNRVDLVKYKEAGGKYADRLKSMGTYIWPCSGTITSHFGHRHSPGNGVGSTNHQGLDIGASMGAPVTAADGGTVVMAKWYSGYGKTVQIQHDDGTITQYSHLSWWEPKVGDVVAQGQEIGKVGSTGNSTGPHLHFGVMKDGHYVDPEDYLNRKS